jgi:hypothetical protein
MSSSSSLPKKGVGTGGAIDHAKAEAAPIARVTPLATLPFTFRVRKSLCRPSMLILFSPANQLKHLTYSST